MVLVYTQRISSVVEVSKYDDITLRVADGELNAARVPSLIEGNRLRQTPSQE